MYIGSSFSQQQFYLHKIKLAFTILVMSKIKACFKFPVEQQFAVFVLSF